MWERFKRVHGTVGIQEIVHWGETKTQAKKNSFFEIFDPQPPSLVGNG